MEYYEIGGVIRDARLRHQMTQEELAFGICSVSTLSKIENGSRVPYARTFEALMKRMGEPARWYVSFLGKMDLKRRHLQRQMEAQLRIGNVPVAEQLLQEYKELAADKTDMEIHASRVIEAGIRLKNEGIQAADEIYKILMAVMRALHPKFDGNGRLEAYYSDSELLLFQMLASCEQKMKQQEQALQRLCWLLAYLEKYADQREYAEEFAPSLYCQLSELCFEMGQYSDSAEYCVRGIKNSLFSGRSACLPGLLTQKVRLAAEAGNTRERPETEKCFGWLDEMLSDMIYLTNGL